MKRLTNVHKFNAAMTLVALLLVGVMGYTMWFVYHSRDVATVSYQASAQSQTVVVDPKQMASIVEDAQNGSAGLVTFLRSQNQGCTPAQTGIAWYRVVKEVNGDQATVEFGCSRTYNDGNGTPARMLVHVVGDQWHFISPTNQWAYNVPSCSMLKANDILATLEPGCWTTQGANGTTVIANQISQYATSYATCAVAQGSHVSKQPIGICATKDGVVFAQR